MGVRSILGAGLDIFAVLVGIIIRMFLISLIVTKRWVSADMKCPLCLGNNALVLVFNPL